VDQETNNALSINDFTAKKQILEERGYKLPHLLKEAEDLTPEIIRANSLRISEIARDIIWKV
jgi:hypothetical protein